MTDTITSQPDRDKVIRAAYAAATARLRDAHLDEFRQYQIEECAKHGVEFTPKPTKAEKAESALVALLAENPDLKARLVDELGGKD